MQVNEHLFVIASEEASEISRAFSRINRFGLDSIHPRTEKTAKEDAVYKINELLAIVELMKDRGVILDGIGDPTSIGEAKKKFVEEMEKSHEAGLIELPDEEEQEEENLDEEEESSEDDLEEEQEQEEEENSEDDLESEEENKEDSSEQEEEELEEEEEV